MRNRSGLHYKIFYVFIYILLALVSVSTIIPLVLTAIVSVTDEQSIIMNGYSFFPEKFSTLAFRMALEGDWVFDAYKVTIFITVVGTFLCVLLSSALGYALSVNKVRYRNKIAMFLFIPMVFNAGLMPWYLWVTRVLHLKNSLFALILPMLINPFWIFLLRNYFKTIPDSLAESAEIDGAGPVYTFLRIILPLSKPILATVVLFSSLSYWNNYTLSLWLIDKQELYPLQYLLYKLQSYIIWLAQNAGSISEGSEIVPSESTQMATFLIALGPIILVYPFIQKYFVKGIMVGAVKG